MWVEVETLLKGRILKVMNALCGDPQAQNNGAYNLKNPFLYSQLLKIPFLIFAPSYARADEDARADELRMLIQ